MHNEIINWTLIESVPKGSVYRDLYATMQKFYFSCLDHRKIFESTSKDYPGSKAYLELMNRLGIEKEMRPGVVSLHREIKAFLTQNKIAANLTEQITFMHTNSMNSIIGAYILADAQRPQQRAIYVGESKRNFQSYQDQKLLEKMKNETVQLFKLIVGTMNQTIIDQVRPAGKTWEDVASDVMTFEKRLSSIADSAV